MMCNPELDNDSSLVKICPWLISLNSLLKNLILITFMYPSPSVVSESGLFCVQLHRRVVNLGSSGVQDFARPLSGYEVEVASFEQ